MDLLFSFILLLVGFVLLWKGGNLLVEGSVQLATFFKIPEFIIGLTLVAFGTSAPELVVNVMAAVAGKSDIVLGNVLGSNISNILLILGISGLIFPLLILKSTVKREIPFSIICTLIFLIFANIWLVMSESVFLPKISGVVLLVLFVAFLCYAMISSKSQVFVEELNEIKIKPSSNLLRSTIFVLLGLIFLPGGGKLVIDSAVIIAKNFHLSEAFISLFLVSLGTSLPELFTCAAAALKQKSEIVIGNVIGSNIFNLLLVLGASLVVGRISYNILFNLDIIILLFATSLLMIFSFTLEKSKIDREEALILLFGYISYLGFLFFRG